MVYKNIKKKCHCDPPKAEKQPLRHCTTANATAPYLTTRLLLRCAHRNDKGVCGVRQSFAGTNVGV
jgi:hypothetical protein